MYDIVVERGGGGSTAAVNLSGLLPIYGKTPILTAKASIKEADTYVPTYLLCYVGLSKRVLFFLMQV